MKKYPILVFVFISAFLFCQPLYGGPVEEEFSEANSLYAGGNYADAASLYEKIADDGVISGDLFYNLGNTYYKLAQKGRAILNYERAAKYIYGDEDLYANYSFVMTLLDIKQPVEDYPWHEKLFLKIRSVFSTDGWFVFSGLIYTALFVILGLTLYNYRLRKQLLVFAAASVLCFSVSIYMFSGSYKDTWKTDDGIILQSKVQVRYSPSYSGAVAFEAGEGMKARIVRSQDGWSLIRMTKKNTGWIESDAIEKI